VKKIFFAVLLATSLVGGAVAADRQSHSVARPEITPPGKVAVHPFIDKKGIAEWKNLVFVSDAANNVVNLYNLAGKQLAQLTGFSEPQGLTVDADGNLYVANTGDSNILIYAPPYSGTPTTLDDSGQFPVDVAVINNGEFVAVTNIISTSDGPGSVTLYKNGKQGATISNSDWARIYFEGFDASGNLYFDGEGTSGAVLVGEIAKLTSGGSTITTLTTNNSIEFPGGVQVTNGGKIAIDDQEGFAVYTYDAPKSGSLGSPIKTTDLTGSGDPVSFAFNGDNRVLWTADASDEAANEFRYPAGGDTKKVISVSGGEPIGVALFPASTPGK
jgi:hypothetical protein